MKKTMIVFLAVIAALFMGAISAHAGVDRILCVPWEGDPDAHHTAISGEEVQLTAVVYGDAAGGTYTYSWELNDGSAPETGTITVPGDGFYNLSITHTFSGAVGATFDTELNIDGKSDTYNIILGPDSNDSRINIAIDKGLWYLHVQMIRTTVGSDSVPAGYWNDSNYYVGRTGGCVWAFEVQGHLLPVEDDPLNPDEDPYVETVQRGINYLLSRLFYQPMNQQTYGWPEDYDGDGDADEGNGYGLVCYYSGGHTNYEHGLALGAISGSGASTATATTGLGTYVKGRTYGDIVQDMADWYAWSQEDAVSFPNGSAYWGARGGWYYTASNNENRGAYYGDNSASQWAYIGLEAAQANFSALIPSWVKTQLAGYLHAQISYSDRGYVSYRSGYSDWTTANVCLTGGALVGMALVGETIYDAHNGAGSYTSDLNGIKNFMGTNWYGTGSRWTENWYGHRAYYTMYAVMKGFRLQGITDLPGSPGTTDWYKDYVGVMIPDQYNDGHFRGTGWMDGYIREDMGTAFGVLILTPSPFSPPPVACYTAEPNPSYLDIPVSFDPSCSYHSDDSKTIELYEWDFDNDGFFEVSSADPDVQVHTWNSSDHSLGTYPVTLRITDNTTPTPVTDTYTLDIDLTNPPHPPVADAGGPYMVSLCPSDTLTLDGSGSFDINEGNSESGSAPFDTIIAWEWDLDGSPWTYESGSGETITAIDISSLSPGTNAIGLKVTDNTEEAFPGSGEPNLTDEDFTTVEVYPACGACDLAAISKSGKVQLSWSPDADSYDIYRSTQGPNTGFDLIADDYTTSYGIYLDLNVTNGTTYYYRIVDNNGCGTNFASATPVARTTIRVPR